MTDTVFEAPDKLEVEYRGEPRELFMTYKRLNSCLRVIGPAQNILNLMIDPDIGEGIVKVMVAESGDTAAMFDVELGEKDLSMDDFDKVLMWVRDHLTSFFVKRLQQTGEFEKSLGPVAIGLKSSLPGLPA